MKQCLLSVTQHFINKFKAFVAHQIRQNVKLPSMNPHNSSWVKISLLCDGLKYNLLDGTRQYISV